NRQPRWGRVRGRVSLHSEFRTDIVFSPWLPEGPAATPTAAPSITASMQTTFLVEKLVDPCRACPHNPVSRDATRLIEDHLLWGDETCASRESASCSWRPWASPAWPRGRPRRPGRNSRCRTATSG